MYIYVKRVMDFCLSLLAIVFLSPIFLLIVIAMKLEEPKGSILFVQKRVGRNKKLFSIYKFRSMKEDAPHDVPTEELESGVDMVTKVGHFLRKTSLDELPQFFNVLKGDMSIVSPRPALWNQYYLIELRNQVKGKYGLCANDLRPGITGWAQINGRDNLSEEQKAQLDGEYVQQISFLMDCHCFFGTFLKVLRREGIKD